MGKLQLKIGFNGERKELFNKIVKSENFIQENDNTLVSKYYYNSNGQLQNGHLIDVPSIKIISIEEVEVIKFECLINFSTTPSYLKLGTRYVRYFENENSEFALLDSDFWSATKLNENSILYEYRLKDAINYADSQGQINKPNKNSFIIIRFPNTLISSETNGLYNYGYIKLNFLEETAYIEYTNETLDNIEVIRTIMNNDLPYFGLTQNDGSINILDKNLYIKERLMTKQLNNYFITKILFNGKMLGKYIGVDGKYPFSSNALSYNLDDYLNLFGNISCDNFYYSGLIPYSGVLNGLELYEKLKEITISKVEIKFQDLNEKISEELSKYIFVDPYIKCSNLKELWEAFLTSVMCVAYINEFGYFELDLIYVTNNELPIVITKEQHEQDLDFDLIPKNAVSKISIKSKVFENRYSLSEELNFMISNVSQDNKFSYSKIINDYIKQLENENNNIFDIKEPSLLFRFCGIETNEKVYNFVIDNTFHQISGAETSILAESFIDLGSNTYQNFYINYSINYNSNDLISEIISIKNNQQYKYKKIWLTKNDYENLKINDMQFDTLYFCSEEYITKTGRLFKSLIPLQMSFDLNNNNQITQENETIVFLGINLQSFYKPIIEVNYQYGENELYKEEYNIYNSNLLVMEENYDIANKVFETDEELFNYSIEKFNKNDIILVCKDSSFNNSSALYVINKNNELEFYKINNLSRYNGIPISVFIANKIKNMYINGRKSIKFTTSVYNFLNSEGIIAYKAENGEILKVGDLIQLSVIGNTKFKITSISAFYSGVLSLTITAYEI